MLKMKKMELERSEVSTVDLYRPFFITAGATECICEIVMCIYSQHIFQTNDFQLEVFFMHELGFFLPAATGKPLQITY